MRITYPERACERSLARMSCLTILVLSGCVHADDPELFQADPNLLSDYHQNLPTHGSSGGFNYEIIQGQAIFEGDIMLGAVNTQGVIKSGFRPRGLGRGDAFGRWPDGIVPYLAPTSNSPTQRMNIELAINHWMEESSITFVERTDNNADQYPHYLRFESTNSCASFVGRQGGEQPVLVSDACSMGSIVHELGHALGLYHEHTRPDRNNFVQVDWDQITSGKDINFEVLSGNVETHGDYDYGSIMHYGEFFFSSTGRPTIIVPDGIEIGQRDALSEIDSQAIDTMYATDLALSQPTFNSTENGLEVDISIANQGNLGAQQLELIVSASDDSQWAGISRNSGWQCESHGSELRCDRATLEEQSDTRFTLLLNSVPSDTGALKMLLSSRTMDTDETNNRFNDDANTLTPTGGTVMAGTAVDQTEQEPQSGEVTPTTEIAAARPTENIALDQSAGAGSDNGSLFALVLATIGLRRYRRRYRKVAA